ncbi:MAG TPA: hypothetical protein VN193_14635 [Candidatus Angelobacter sp.]|jgi:hypothetical protein|nr:hypothetical protein [Candidatus Angelobacter sp.]
MIRLAAAFRADGRALALPLAAALPLLATGCGPSVQVQLGMKNVPLSITVGTRPLPEAPRPGAPAPAPLAEALPVYSVPQLAVPAALPIPHGTGFVLPPPPPDDLACPPLDPLKPSAAAATTEVSDAATAGRWAFLQTGNVTRGGAPAAPLAAATTGTVSAVTQPAQGSFGFTEAGAVLGFPDSAGEYAATNSSAQPSTPLVSPTSRFALAGLSIPVPGGAVVFKPAAALTLLSTPAAQASQYQPDPNNPGTPGTTGTWKDSQTDPVTGTAMTIDATDLGRIRVNACGTPVDAWQVQATITLVATQVSTASGTAPATTNLTEKVTYAVATGLGGLIVQWTAAAQPQSTLAGAPFALDGSATLSSVTPAPLP